jgi:hypothetical protein
MTIHFAAVTVAALVLAGCNDGQRGATSPPQPQAAGPEPRLYTTAPPARADVECAAPIDLTPPIEVKVGDRAATQAGYKLTFEDRDADGTLVLGLLGPLDEDSDPNLLAIGRYLQFFSAQKADAIVVTGSVGETAQGIARALLALAQARLPVLVLAGSRECRADFTNGVLVAQRTASNVVNMNQVRAVEFPEATLVSLPGFHDPSYLVCATGCQYFKSTVDEVVRMAREARNPVVLVAHGSPRGDGPQALDYTSFGTHVGDGEINRAIRDGNIPFGVFSSVREGGGRGTDAAEGGRVVSEGEASKRLYVNPGPADTVRWEMNDGTYCAGMTAVLRLTGDQASFKTFPAKSRTRAEKAKALMREPPSRKRDRTMVGQSGTAPGRTARAAKAGRP